jgi:hypothetical protein
VAVLMEGRRIPDDMLESALAEWGEEGAVELVVLVGYYCLLSDLMRTFRVE